MKTVNTEIYLEDLGLFHSICEPYRLLFHLTIVTEDIIFHIEVRTARVKAKDQLVTYQMYLSYDSVRFWNLYFEADHTNNDPCQ
ncbi:unnamed protein product [Acanthoscelides obtectus]|uniref:Uncharacterized protein n=1 Tax=Acanthoscelides obtectus TaxID=200917 RepID=A0A9P0LD75_ACAOB|nr:unnamed protein product [Acanthoscelides obtectus]CAK1620748.1 hypothetical protein AOBTE_LOCUS537 [Acanthoscelides obtectus]